MRIKALKTEMEKNNVTYYLSTSLSNIYYLTGHRETGDSTLFLLIPIDAEAILYAPEINYTLVAEEAKGCIVEKVKRQEEFLEKIVARIKEDKVKQVCFDDLTVTSYKSLKKKLRNIKLEPRTDMLWNLRKLKDPIELEYIKKAAELSDIGIKTALEFLRAGLREYEVAAEAEYAMRKLGSEGVAFETIVASGPRSALPHGVCGNRKIERGDAVTIDIGAIYRGYKGDITRTEFIGTPSQKQLNVYRAVFSAQKKALENIKAGMTAKDADNIAREVVKEKGLGKYFIHGLGHGLGIDVHEPPRLSATSNEILNSKNVVTIEPGVYLPNLFGVRIEDTTVVTDKNLRTLTKTEVKVY
jgi:Xaa-Pro aminopeptidase